MREVLPKVRISKRMHHELSPQMRNESKWDEVRLADPRREIRSIMAHARFPLRPGAGDVRFGSKADMCSAKRHARFTPNSGHGQCTRRCPLCAKSGHQRTYSDRNVNGSLFCAQLGANSILRSTRFDKQIVVVIRPGLHNRTLGIPPGLMSAKCQ